jgi:predicted membrane metal-binding protein
MTCFVAFAISCLRAFDLSPSLSLCISLSLALALSPSRSLSLSLSLSLALALSASPSPSRSPSRSPWRWWSVWSIPETGVAIDCAQYLYIAAAQNVGAAFLATDATFPAGHEEERRPG